MAGKPIRLGKAAGELNVGIATLVEFLDKKGVKIDANPNTKLDPEHYEILQKEFAADQNLKEQSKFTTAVREKRETVSLRDTKQEEVVAKDEDLEPINVEKIKQSVLEEPSKQIDVHEEEDSIVEVKPTSTPEVQVQIVGKIDLDKLNTKTRPDKKKPEAEEKQPEQVVEIIETPVEVPKPEKEVAAIQETPEIETIRVERTVLTGPTVLGKIELPVEKPKTPGAKPGQNSFAESRKKTKKN